MVAPPRPGRAVGRAEQRIEFRFGQEGDEPSVETLAWNGEHALDYGGMLWMSQRCVPEQRTDGRKSSVAGARTIFPLLLKIVEEGADERRIKIADVQLRRLDVLPRGCEDEQQPQRVPVGRQVPSCGTSEVPLQTITNQRQQLWRSREIPVCADGIDVAEVGRQQRDPVPRLPAISISVKDGIDGESMP